MAWTKEEQKTHRKLLTDALRSGEYVQGTGTLRSWDDRYCCLGVACDLFTKINSSIQWEKSGNNWNIVEKKGDLLLSSHAAFLPSEVQEWLGFNDHMASFENLSLVTLNDTGKSFSEIAAVIDSEPEGLIEN